MEFIKNNLGPNKISLSINSNEYEETQAINKLYDEINGFDGIDNIVDKFRNLRNTEFGKVNPRAQPSKNYQDNRERIETENTSISRVQSNLVITPGDINDKLIYTIYSSIEPSITLFKQMDINVKINAFKEELIKNLTIAKMFKKLDLHKLYDEPEIIKAIKYSKNSVKERLPMLVYLSRLINKSIIIYNNIDNYIEHIENISINVKDTLVLKETNGNFEIIEEEFNKDKILNTKISNYLKDNLVDKLDILLVKELKIIAENLDITLFKLDENNKKKPLLKNELKDLIKEKLI
jgi:hypothetical protein